MSNAPTAVISGTRRPSGGEGRAQGETLLVILGLAFLLIGLVDLALLWFPAHFDSLSWEFATVGRTLDGLPMSALGLGLVGYGRYRGRRTTSTQFLVLAAGFGLAAILVLALGILFVTSLPSVLQQSGLQALEGVQRAAIRHGVQAIVYPVAFGLIARLLWKISRAPD